MSNLTDSGSLVNKSSRVTKEAWIYSLLILSLYKLKPFDSLSLYSNVCFMRSINPLALDCSYVLKECERCLHSSLIGSPLRSRYLFSAMDSRSSPVDWALLIYMNCRRQ